MEQAEIGEGLVNKYAWATPTNDCLKIFREFSPIVEVGCGSNAYWSKYMRQTAGIDVVAYDMNVHEGGKIHSKAAAATTVGAKKRKKKRDKTTQSGDETGSSNAFLRKGGPKVLKLPELQNHTLFLCYPDEEDGPVPDDSGSDVFNPDKQDHRRPLSFGWQCLTEYKGTYVIHVGELAVLGDATLSMEQSPWGRSSSAEFQQRLASEFHCIAKIQLPNWLHVRDSLSVWKRSEICQMVFVADDDDDDDDESGEVIEYRHIAPEEMLPKSVIAPCMEHVLAPTPTSKSIIPEAQLRADAEKSNEANADQNFVSTGDESQESKTKIETENDADDENEDEMQTKKTKSGLRKEWKKRKRILSTQRSSSQNSGDEDKRKRRKEKERRSEHFRIHGKLPT